MSNECDICKIVDNKDSFNVIYEDELCFAMLHEAPGNIGHAIVIPKTHFPIFEEVPDDILERCFLVANRISVAVFETLGAHGTNILVNNGSTPLLSGRNQHKVLSFRIHRSRYARVIEFDDTSATGLKAALSR